MIKKEEWEQIKKELSGIYGVVEFELDNKKITVAKRMISENKLALIVYIDEKIDYSLCLGDKENEIVKKVWCKKTRSVYTAKEKASLIKIWGKREIKKHHDLDKKSIGYSPCFNTYSVLERQYKKLKDLSLVTKFE